MASRTSIRTLADLERTARALSTHFDSDLVVIVGSQSILVGWPDAPVRMRTSGELDAYPANARLWESRESERAGEAVEASEEINALFGIGSDFDHSHGFYIDGVDENTAKLPPDWKTRAVYREVQRLDGTTATAIAPEPKDMVAAKLYRLEEKDRGYIEALYLARPFDRGEVLARFASTGPAPELMARAKRFLEALPDRVPDRNQEVLLDMLPPYPPDTHCAFWDAGRAAVVVRGSRLGCSARPVQQAGQPARPRRGGARL